MEPLEDDTFLAVKDKETEEMTKYPMTVLAPSQLVRENKKKEFLPIDIKVLKSAREGCNSFEERQNMLSDVAAIVEDCQRHTTRDGRKPLTEEERNKLWEKLAFRGINNGHAEKRRLENSNICLVLVAYTADGLPIGYSDSAYDGSDTLEAGILVRDGYEGRGVGLRLMRQHIIEAKKMGTKKIKGIVLRRNKLMNKKLEQDWREPLKDLCTITEEYDFNDPLGGIKGPALRDPYANRTHVLTW